MMNCFLWSAEERNPYGHLWADFLEDVEASTSHNPMGLHGLLQGELYLYFKVITLPIDTFVSAICQ
jgi:hypothetical protein